MIHWLVQSATAHTALAAGQPPPGLLSPAEARTFATLKSAKRQQDWLLGRWTAKHLLQPLLARENGRFPSLAEIEIHSQPGGAPCVRSPWTAAAPSISISHGHGRALCAAWLHPAAAIGADLERVEPRSAAFVQDYLTPAEMALLPTDATRDTLVTAVWSAKEAVLKALGLGLTVDTRAVTCLIQPLPWPTDTWQPFTITLDPQRLGNSRPALTGWWRLLDDLVLTLAVPVQPLNANAYTEVFHE